MRQNNTGNNRDNDWSGQDQWGVEDQGLWETENQPSQWQWGVEDQSSQQQRAAPNRASQQQLGVESQARRQQRGNHQSQPPIHQRQREAETRQANEVPVFRPNARTTANDIPRERRRRPITTPSILYVGGLNGPGRVISVRDLVYMFGHAAQPERKRSPRERSSPVLDIFYPNGNRYAHIQMCNEEAARRAKEMMDRSWFFDKFISVDYGRNRRYEYFLSGRQVPAKRVQFGAASNRCWNDQMNMNGVNGNVDDDEQNRKDAFFARQSTGMTRYLQPGTIGPDGRNAQIIVEKLDAVRRDKNAHPEIEREVERQRQQPSAVLHVSGLESRKNGKLLTRYDLIDLFSCYGEVLDCTVQLFRKPLENRADTNHFALVQMRSVEQATKAMHALDYTWQMGRFVKVTYGRYQKMMRISHEEVIAIRKKREQKLRHSDVAGSSGRQVVVEGTDANDAKKKQRKKKKKKTRVGGGMVLPQDSGISGLNQDGGKGEDGAKKEKQRTKKKQRRKAMDQSGDSSAYFSC